MYHSKKIALFISHIFGDYQKNVCQGVVDEAAEYGFQTEVYTTSDGENLGQYGVGETSILRIPSFDDFSGIIIASGTYPEQALKDQIICLLKEKCSCPIIEIAEVNAQFPSISLENNLTTGTLTEHLILAHGCKRICYLGCSRESFFSDQREHAYRNVMTRHSLAVDVQDVYACGYSEAEAAEALRYFTNGGSDLPDAIVCYNDHMALLFMVTAVKSGYRIPKDFALVGCDALPEGQNIIPALTTVSFPSYQVGVEAIGQLMKLIRKDSIPDRTSVFAEPVMGGSCGCSHSAPDNSILFVHQLLERIGTLERSIFTSMRMSADFSHATDIDDGMELLAQYVAELDGCSEFYVCLYSDWDVLSGHIMELIDTSESNEADADTILLKLAVKNGKRLPECSFPKKTLLPEYINRNSSNVHIVSPLFFEQREFGYIVLAYENNQVNYPFQMMHWLMNITQLLQNLCEMKGSKLMQAKLESIYMRDSLTELFNRHGYEYRLPQLLARTRDTQTLTAFLFDMDCLKVINDEFGHTEGDFALQVIGQTLQKAVGEHAEDTICTRLGGDEFYVLSNRFDDTSAADFVAQVHKYLGNYNQLSTKPYLLSVSAGFSAVSYHTGMSAEEIDALIDRADIDMYQSKKSKVKNVLRTSA